MTWNEVNSVILLINNAPYKDGPSCKFKAKES